MFKMLFIFKIVIALLLIYMSFYDFKFKQVKLIPMIILTILTVLIMVFSKYKLEKILICFVSLTILSLISKFTNQKLGYGDSVVLGIMALQYSLLNYFEFLILTFMFSAIVGLIILFFSKEKHIIEIPLIPFLTISYLILSFINI